MATVWFYQIQRTSLEAELPRLLERTLQSGRRALVVTGSQARAEALAEHLWTYDERGFLPHGTARDGRAAEQPVYLAAEAANANAAQFLFLVDGAVEADWQAFERCHLVFDGRDAAALAAARSTWKALKAAGHELAYWRQKEAGGWEKAG
ncbi:MAG: DNA polymerase III subunit chi [Thalassobaculales bacterium]